MTTHCFHYLIRSSILILSFFVTIKSSGQATDSLRNFAPKVFIDCNFCDEDYIRQNITFVNYVRDRKLADVHLMVTEQETGSGGSEFTLTFIGQNKFSNMNDTLAFNTKQDDTGDEIREKGNQYIMIGLIPYISKTPIAQAITINYEDMEDPNAVEDKWNNWVFTMDFNGYFNGQELSSSSNIWTSLEAVRITPDWKIEMEASFQYGTSKYILEDETITGLTSGKYFEVLVVKSLGEHWSVGGFSMLYSSYFNNINTAYKLAPAIEYNLFPYSESTRKQLRFLYTLDTKYNFYNDTTIYEQTKEGMLGQSLGIALGIKQPWGSVNTSVNGSHYFHNTSLNRLSLNTNLNLRLFKGLSLSLWANIVLIHDQISLPKEGASDEDVLLRQKQLATQYRYYGSIGLSYTFGSIYNNIVNPRFGN
jgi:hypothetical protein